MKSSRKFSRSFQSAVNLRQHTTWYWVNYIQTLGKLTLTILNWRKKPTLSYAYFTASNELVADAYSVIRKAVPRSATLTASLVRSTTLSVLILCCILLYLCMMFFYFTLSICTFSDPLHWASSLTRLIRAPEFSQNIEILQRDDNLLTLQTFFHFYSFFSASFMTNIHSRTFLTVWQV